MDKRLVRGVILSIIGGGLIWFGKGITEASGEDRLVENAMIVGIIIGAYTIILGLCSLYDYIVNPPEHEEY